MWSKWQAVLGALAALATARAYPAAWSVTPGLTTGVEHDSNRTLAQDPVPSEGLSVAADALMQRATERGTLFLHPAVDGVRYTDRRIPTQQNGSVDTGLTGSTERSTWSLDAIWRDQSTLYSELLTTGILDLRTRRRDEQFSGSWTLSQSARRSLTLSATYLDVAYRGNATSLLLDNSFTSIDALERVSLRPRWTLLFDASYGQYRPREAGSAVTGSRSASLGLNYSLSERNSVQLLLGQNDRTVGSSRSSGLVGSLNLSRSTLTGSLTASISRTVQPSGFGVFSQSDQAQIGFNRGLSERLGLHGSVSRYRTSSAFSTLILAERTYTTGQLGLAYQLSPQWLVTGTVAQDRVEAPRALLQYAGSAQGWRVSVASVWRPLPRARSR